MRLQYRNLLPRRPCAGWMVGLGGSPSSAHTLRQFEQRNTGAAQRLLRCPRGIDHMPVYRADRESLLLQGNIPRCIRRIVFALLDPRQPRREIRREEKTHEAYAMRVGK